VEHSKQASDDENRFEKENRAFYDRVSRGYMAILKRAPERVVQVDAKDPVLKVHKKIVTIVEDRLLAKESI
jgi:thymidylate kinase